MSDDEKNLYSHCRGRGIPLPARLPGWMVKSLDRKFLDQWVETHDSPLNVHNPQRFAENLNSLQDIARSRRVSFRPYFARKANKCLSYVETALRLGAGIDTASENEVLQTLQFTENGSDIVCTAAVKSHSLIELCIRRDVTIVVDNADEFAAIRTVAEQLDKPAEIAIRLSGFEFDGGTLHSRFGFPVHEAEELIASLRTSGSVNFQLIGLHFHLDGYRAEHRSAALAQTLSLYYSLRHRKLISEKNGRNFFIDIGGGLPTRYLESDADWQEWQALHRQAVMQKCSPVTKGNNGLGLLKVGEELVGNVRCYPPAQPDSAAQWLGKILDSRFQGNTIGEQLANSAIELRCEPGRALLSGCGYTVAEVVFRKHDTRGEWVIGLNMNRTQSRSGFSEHMTDPILLPNPEADRTPGITGYLAGTYCTESEWITLREMAFSHGIAIGDYIIFPDTAGYLMHFVESRSHQLPLAKNVVIQQSDGGWESRLDEIDR